MNARDDHPLDWYPEPVSEAEQRAWQAGEETDSLALIDRARAALAQAETLADIGVVREIAERARRYASAAKLGRAAENHAARLRLEAERKAGELLANMDRQRRGRPGNCAHDADLPLPKLPELGVTHRQASDWQVMARMPQEDFKAHVEKAQAADEPLTTAGVVKIVRLNSKMRARARKWLKVSRLSRSTRARERGDRSGATEGEMVRSLSERSRTAGGTTVVRVPMPGETSRQLEQSSSG
jgi:hypothetical protein